MAKQPKRLGTLGWQSILTVKDELLYKYKLAQRYSKNHSVQVHHGKVAEAVFRQMLGEFLPKRYGVTAGYITSQSLDISSDDKISHFDVIIYDQLESPVLWIEKSPDSTEVELIGQYLLNM
jgi:hypothetical protein